MKTIWIYFNDLKSEKQQELLDTVGAKDPEEMNWDMDIISIAFFDYEEDVE